MQPPFAFPIYAHPGRFLPMTGPAQCACCVGRSLGNVMALARLGQLGARVATLDTRRVHAPPKKADPLYHSTDFKEWREQVIDRAGGRCEAVENGKRCTKARPRHRMFADHIREVRDGGERFALSNGQCLCGSHHTAKTAKAKADRRAG